MTAANNEEVDENGKLYSDLHYTLNLVSFEPWVLKKQKTWKKNLSYQNHDIKNYNIKDILVN